MIMLKDHVFSLITFFILFASYGGSLSSTSKVSFGIKFSIILRIVLLKTATFSLTEVFVKTFSQSNRSIARYIWLIFASW